MSKVGTARSGGKVRVGAGNDNDERKDGNKLGGKGDGERRKEGETRNVYKQGNDWQAERQTKTLRRDRNVMHDTCPSRSDVLLEVNMQGHARHNVLTQASCQSCQATADAAESRNARNAPAAALEATGPALGACGTCCLMWEGDHTWR